MKHGPNLCLRVDHKTKGYVTFTIGWSLGRVPARISVANILNEVANIYGVAVAEMKGPGRKQRTVLPRQEAMYRLKKELRLSLPHIGRIFDRDHTTVLHAIRRHEARLATRFHDHVTDMVAA